MKFELSFDVDGANAADLDEQITRRLEHFQPEGTWIVHASTAAREIINAGGKRDIFGYTASVSATLVSRPGANAQPLEGHTKRDDKETTR